MRRLLAITLLLGLLISPSPTLAQNSAFTDAVESLDKVETETVGRGPQRDDRLEVTIAAIIQVAVSLIGVILIILIIYAGFLWMTARGNDEQVDRARSYIKNAVIGIFVILMAYTITIFIIQQLTTAVFDSARFLRLSN